MYLASLFIGYCVSRRTLGAWFTLAEQIYSDGTVGKNGRNALFTINGYLSLWNNFTDEPGLLHRIFQFEISPAGKCFVDPKHLFCPPLTQTLINGHHEHLPDQLFVPNMYQKFSGPEVSRKYQKNRKLLRLVPHQLTFVTIDEKSNRFWLVFLCV